MSVYLDHNATARVRPEAIAAITSVLTHVGNPSSIHAAGRTARAVMEQAREDIGALDRRAGVHRDLHQRRHRGQRPRPRERRRGGVEAAHRLGHRA